MNLKSWLANLRAFGTAPIFFFGLGIYRAWTELVYVRPTIETPAHLIAGHDVYDISMSIVLILCALFAKRLIPIYKRKPLAALCVLLMTVGTILSVLSLFFPIFASPVLSYTAAITSGIGTALVILYWSELYGCLNPYRVALFYSGSLIFSAILIFLFNGLIDNYYLAGVVILPVLSMIFLYRSYTYVKPENLPKKDWGRFSFPWKPTALMVVYGFAFGLQEPELYLSSGPHSHIGTVIASCIVFFGMIFLPSRFNIAITYRVALPLMVCGLMLASTSGIFGTEVANVFMSMSFASFSILTMLILSNITYRFGVGAVWLFGVERALRAVAMLLGRITSELMKQDVLGFGASNIMPTLIVISLVIIASVILLSEKELASRWGISLLGNNNEVVDAQEALAVACSRIRKEYDLSLREEEVLLLLARKQKLATIETELFIANGTVKAHIRHIYKKMGIHSRKELYQILEIDENQQDN